MSRIDWDDFEWLKKTAMPYFGVNHLRMEWSQSKKIYPDIWVKLGKVSVITVTREWARQNKDERRKRLVHEIGHIFGLQHGRIGKYLYSTFPKKDSYSLYVYKSMSGGRK